MIEQIQPSSAAALSSVKPHTATTEDGFEAFAKILGVVSEAEAAASKATSDASLQAVPVVEEEKPLSAASLLAASLTSALWAGQLASFAAAQPETQSALRISPKEHQNNLLLLANNLSQHQPELAHHLVAVWQLGDTGLASAA